MEEVQEEGWESIRKKMFRLKCHSYLEMELLRGKLDKLDFEFRGYLLGWILGYESRLELLEWRRGWGREMYYLAAYSTCISNTVPGLL